MITVRSNINEFLKGYTEKTNRLQAVLKNFAKKLAERMAEDMNSKIESSKSKWAEPQIFLDTLPKVDFDIKETGNNSVIIEIGNNLPKRKVGNTVYSIYPETQQEKFINPIFFIEFGFGVKGEQKPSEIYTTYGWKYNLNDHGSKTENPWKFYDEMRSLRTSSGQEGINFMYNTIEEYKDKWKDYLKELLES